MPATPSATSQRNITILTGAQALGAASPAIIISLGGLVGQNLSTDPALATLPVSTFQAGLALGTLPAAYLMHRLGRRNAYLMGAGMGIISGLVAAYAILSGWFLLFCLGTVIAGFYSSYVQSYRFAATDGLDSSLRAKAISWIMVGGLAAAIIGPQIVILTRDIWPETPFAASFIGQSVLALLALPLLALLRQPAASAQPQHEQDATARPLKDIARSLSFITAIATGVASYGLMSFLMTAAPMAMVGHDHSLRDASLGIQWHILAMFGPSFFTGKLIQRFGSTSIAALGLILIAASAAAALNGLSVSHFWLALILLGVGWNFSFIGATDMITATHNHAERAKVQAANDFIMFGVVAIASFSSGQLLSTSGWDSLNLLVFPLVGAVLVLMLANHLNSRR
ncbi:MFS transporter [Kerstersia sp.]|uniref:MFS transporter n=1 Tax=Kerstersia sp. TaxID=1930783 RepID=UPI003F901AFB